MTKQGTGSQNALPTPPDRPARQSAGRAALSPPAGRQGNDRIVVATIQHLTTSSVDLAPTSAGKRIEQRMVVELEERRQRAAATVPRRPKIARPPATRRQL